MLGPYRSPPPPIPEAPPAPPAEEVVLAWALLVLGAVRVVYAVLAAEVWGAEATLASLLLVAGLGMLVRRS